MPNRFIIVFHSFGVVLKEPKKDYVKPRIKEEFQYLIVGWTTKGGENGLKIG